MAYESFDNINQHELEAVIEAEINLFENTRSTNTYTNMEAPTFQEQFQPNFLQQQQQQFQPNFLQQQQLLFVYNSLKFVYNCFIKIKRFLFLIYIKFELILLGIKSAFAGKGRHPKLAAN